MNCEQCGAPSRDGGAFCSHCGGRIKRPVDMTPAHLSATAQERFDLVEKNSGYANACAHQPKVTPPANLRYAWVGIIGMVVFTAFVIGSVLWFTAQQARSDQQFNEKLAGVKLDLSHKIGRMDFPANTEFPFKSNGPWPLLGLFFGPLVLAGIGLFSVQLYRANKFMAAPVRHLIGVVVDERVEVTGGREDHPARTQYFASLQSRDGTRTEHRCESLLAGRIAAPDIGVAFIKAGHLVDFIRFEV